MLAIGSCKNFIPFLTALAFCTAGLYATTVISRKYIWGAHLDADHPPMRQVLLGYVLPVAGLSLI